MVVKNPAEIDWADEAKRKVRPLTCMTLKGESEMILL